jgi:hypothetical protein
MPTIRMTEETMAAIRRAAIYDFHQTGKRQADGTWLVDVSDEVAARLEEFAHPGETIDDTVQRIIRQHRGDRPN